MVKNPLAIGRECQRELGVGCRGLSPRWSPHEDEKDRREQEYSRSLAEPGRTAAHV